MENFLAGPGLHWKWSAWACSLVLGAVWVSVRRGGELVLSAWAAEALAGPVAAAAELVDEAFHWPVPLQLVGEVLEVALQASAKAWDLVRPEVEAPS